MSVFDLIRIAAEAEPPQIDWLTPVVTIAGPVLVAIVAGVSTVYRRRQDRDDTVADREAAKGLSEKDELSEIDRARAQVIRYYDLYMAVRIAFDFVQSALRHLVRIVRDNHPDHEFDQEVIDALAMKPPSVAPEK